ncbi:NADH-quinone oxidoreductase subunit NuoF [candidate division KSB1 bacterium]|nr:NADH-quinone oxidoreductase subunit NuoF [candidate division KSB1 bacterium]
MSDIKILLNFLRNGKTHTLADYMQRGGYQTLKQKIPQLTPAQIVQEVKTSNIRGRGGAGFPAGLKWSFLAKDTGKPVYLICNADEGEPGTFKDRLILEENPHQLIEGLIITSYAINASQTFVYIRGEYGFSYRRLKAAVDEAYTAGLLGKKIPGTDHIPNIVLHRGAGAYVVGDETGLMNSIEGKKGFTRIKPPFPAVAGLYNCPTIINNVETLASIPWIVQNGGEAYKAIGTEKSTGTKLISVSGHICKPGVYEVTMGYPFQEFLKNECGGMLAGRKLKAVIPGGSSTPVLKPEDVEQMTLDYESIQAAGSSLGSGGMIIIAEGTCMVRLLMILADFYHHESCGQCTPCREGTGWLAQIITRIENGMGRPEDLDEIPRISRFICGYTICPLGDAACGPVDSFLKKFRNEFEEHITKQRCPYGGKFTRFQELSK